MKTGLHLLASLIERIRRGFRGRIVRIVLPVTLGEVGLGVLGKWNQMNRAAAEPTGQPAEMPKKDGDVELRKAAVEALGRPGTDPKTAAPALIVALRDPEPSVRSAAGWSLSHFGKDASPAVPALIENLADADESVRTGVVEALTSLGPASAARSWVSTPTSRRPTATSGTN